MNVSILMTMVYFIKKQALKDQLRKENNLKNRYAEIKEVCKLVLSEYFRAKISSGLFPH